MPDKTYTSSGLALKIGLRLFTVVVSNQTGLAGTCELIDDVTNNAARHKFTVPCPTGDIRGFTVPEGMMYFSIGLWLNLTSVTEVLIVYG